MKVLVVDDSIAMRKILEKVLKGIESIDEVELAEDGKIAVEKITAGAFDLVLMDWNMPNMTGIEALRAVRGAGNKTPIVMVTTEAEKTRIIDAIKSGANNYIIKPFTPDVITEKIQATLDSLKAKTA
ncbi:response regulator [Candidatus Sumerlaeota bacterium]|nr:response regulator [Candidatus Sumerlaeota bacterium]